MVETKLSLVDATTLEIRYYDDGPDGKYRSWKMPLQQARDLVQWWTETGSRLNSVRGAKREQRVGNMLAAVMSDTEIYARACDLRGRGAIAGYQLPREALANLADWMATVCESGGSRGTVA